MSGARGLRIQSIANGTYLCRKMNPFDGSVGAFDKELRIWAEPLAGKAR